MSFKDIWKLTIKLDKWAHLCGAFMLTTVAIQFTDPITAVIFIAIGSIGLEVYQCQYEPDYPLKKTDTALDLVADGIGIALAVMV